MKKSLTLSLLLAVSVAAGSTAFAAVSPFTDVPLKHWSYDAVSKLAKDGIIDGYSNKTFQGDNTMTRYEMAQIVGKAMVKAEKANNEDKKLIDKLSNEFAAELKNMGVRVAALEKNQPNLKITGSFDTRYQSKMKESTDASTVKGQNRLRLSGEAKVDDNTSFRFRMVNKTDKTAKSFAYNGTFTDFGSNQTDGTVVSLDHVYIGTKLGAVKTTIGDQPIKFGANDFVLDSSNYSFDGIRFEGQTGNVNLSANWGRFQSNVDFASLEASSSAGKLSYGIGYATLKDNKTGDSYANKTLAKYLDLNVRYQVNNNFSIGGEHVINNATDAAYTEKGKASLIYALIGNQKLKKQGENNLALNYWKTNNNGLTQWTGFDTVEAGKDAYLGNVTYKGFSAKYTYAFSKTFTGWLFYEKVSDESNVAKAKLGGYRIYRAGVTAKF